MVRERIIWACVVLLVAAGGFFVGRQDGIALGEQNVQQTAAQFNADRGGFFGAGGGAAGTPGVPRQNGQGRRGQNLVGTVDKIDGDSIVVKTQAGDTQTIQLQSGATIRKQVNGAASDIHVGDRIVAIGTRSGTVFQATAVQLSIPGAQPGT